MYIRWEKKSFTKYREDNTGGEDGGEEITDGDDQSLPGKVVPDRVVGGEGNEAAERQAKGVEDLRGGV